MPKALGPASPFPLAVSGSSHLGQSTFMSILVAGVVPFTWLLRRGRGEKAAKMIIRRG